MVLSNLFSNHYLWVGNGVGYARNQGVGVGCLGYQLHSPGCNAYQHYRKIHVRQTEHCQACCALSQQPDHAEVTSHYNNCTVLY